MPAPYNDKMPPTLRFPRLTRDEVDDLVAGHPSAIDAGDVLIDPIYRVDRSMKIDTSRLCARPGRFIGVNDLVGPAEDPAKAFSDFCAASLADQDARPDILIMHPNDVVKYHEATRSADAASEAVQGPEADGPADPV